MRKILKLNSVLNTSRRYSKGCFDFDVLVVGGGHAGRHLFSGFQILVLTS